MHVTHDHDEALAISTDLAILTGQLRQADPASQVTAAPADPDTARLLGWTELGPGTADHGTVTAGQLCLPGAAPPGTHGLVGVFYRPEDLLLGTPPVGTHAAASLTAPAAQILPTRPLARITLAADPPLIALLLHRDLQLLRPQPGEPVTVTIPPAASAFSPRHQTPPETASTAPSHTSPRCDRDVSPGQSAIRPGTSAR